jgi:hypothetical protein
MISELKDDDILEFLMNSDFEGDYSPEELKYLLIKWRYFYRGLHGKLTRSKDDKIGEVSKLSDEILGLKNQVSQLQMSAVKTEDVISSLKNRKLTWSERLSGKIITKEDEDQ